MNNHQVSVQALKNSANSVSNTLGTLTTALTTLSAGNIADDTFGVIGSEIGTGATYQKRHMEMLDNLHSAITLCQGIIHSLNETADNYDRTESHNTTLMKELGHG